MPSQTSPAQVALLFEVEQLAEHPTSSVATTSPACVPVVNVSVSVPSVKASNTVPSSQLKLVFEVGSYRHVPRTAAGPVFCAAPPVPALPPPPSFTAPPVPPLPVATCPVIGSSGLQAASPSAIERTIRVLPRIFIVASLWVSDGPHSNDRARHARRSGRADSPVRGAGGVSAVGACRR